MDERLIALLARAVGLGLLPSSALLPTEPPRPWPVVLLTALGAWLAALPLLILVSLLFGGALTRGGGAYGVGVLLVVGAVVVLRSKDPVLFIEQLAVPLLLVGGGCLGIGLLRDLPPRGGAAVLALISTAVAFAVPAAWLRSLLGAAAAGLCAVALLADRSFGVGAGVGMSVWLAWHALLLVWLLMLFAQQRNLPVGKPVRHAPVVEAFAAGWLLVALMGLAFWSGMGFLVGGAVGLNGVVSSSAAPVAKKALWLLWSTQFASALCAATAAAWAAACWPHLRKGVWLLPAAMLIGLAALRPMLGAALFVLAVCATTQRFRLAAAASAAAAWIVGSFYYDLAWTLATKAAVLAATGAVLGLVAWRISSKQARAVRPSARRVRIGARELALALSLVVTGAVAAGAIWQKEKLIATGTRVFVELAPVDPRSLMQGDYMRLNFRLPPDVNQLVLSPGAERPKVAAARDARGIASVSRVLRPAETVAVGELAIELTPHEGGWMLVTDAWFFREGEGARWSRAKYGEFRVLPDGRALLVGMADAELKPIAR